jgi:phosphoglycolate phosphatase-like HAD superfamily hydrolase
MNAIRNIEAVLFDFDGTLAPNLDLPDMRRQVVDLTVSAGIPGARV